MTKSAHQSDIPYPIIKEAAEWLTRVHEEPLSRSEQDALDRWCAQSVLHQQAWQRAEQIAGTFRDIPSNIGMQVLDRPQSIDRRQFTKQLIALLTVAPTAVAAYHFLPWQGLTADYKTAKGEQQTVRLADGSMLMLNTDSAVDVTFNQQHRLINLHRGEIYIVTAHDPLQKPFYVDTKEGRLQALGTKFVVRKDDETNYLAVIESAVEISPKDNVQQQTIIKAGEQAVFNSMNILQQSALDENANAWINGVIYADNMPLPQFIDLLKRYRTGVIRCDESCSTVSISGVFQLNNPDEILRVLEKTRPINITWRTQYWATITKTSDS